MHFNCKKSIGVTIKIVSIASLLLFQSCSWGLDMNEKITFYKKGAPIAENSDDFLVTELAIEKSFIARFRKVYSNVRIKMSDMSPYSVFEKQLSSERSEKAKEFESSDEYKQADKKSRHYIKQKFLTKLGYGEIQDKESLYIYI